MAPTVQPPALELVHTYRMHVSQKYLDLTRQKLELVRLPQAPRNAPRTLDVGATKEDLEPLIDHWLGAYSWRKQEDHYNDLLPQFRVPVNGIRLHFVHKRSQTPSAVPLLFIHGVPESVLAISKMIDALRNPVPNPSHEVVTPFHVVAPSIPGMGFSDPVSEHANNIQSTCDIFDALMKGLGYHQYIIHGSGWGFNIGRAIALTHPESCMALHTVNPEVPAPRFGSSPSVWLKSRIAKLIAALPRRSGFDYRANDTQTLSMPSDIPMQSSSMTPPITPNAAQSHPQRPQTAAYALCDSPSGLLAYVYDAIRPEANKHTSSSQSPEILRRPSAAAQSPMSPPRYTQSYGGTPASHSSVSTTASSPEATRSPVLERSPGPGHSPQTPQASDLGNPWTPTALIDWTMLYWLPGPEAALRWLVNSSTLMSMYWSGFCMVPLGISHFRDPSVSGTGTGHAPPQWAEAYHRVAMVRRREGRVRFPAWEAPAELVMDIREFVGLLGIFDAAPAPSVGMW